MREQAQFIDELRQRYRRLDGLLVKFRDRISADELWDVNLCVLALRRLLFGGIGDPNWPAGDAPKAPKEIEEPLAGAARRCLYVVPMSVHDPADDPEVIP